MNVIPHDPLIDEIFHSEKVHNSARQSILNVLKTRHFKRGIEVGVQYGQGSEMWLENNVVEEMYGIDPYMTEIGEVSPLGKSRDNETYGLAMGKLSRFRDRYTHIRKTSMEALGDIPGTVDFIYLDAGKDKKSILDDLAYWYPKIKVGGIMFGHDYNHTSYPHITNLVDQYFGKKPNVEEGGIWWVEKRTIKREPKVSVVTPFYNTGFWAPDVFNEILEDPRIDEVIVVDDCSIDGETYMLKNTINGNPKIKYFRNEENLGELKTRIRGSQLAQNDWVIFLDGDNSLTQSYLDEIYRIPRWKENVIYCPDFGNVKHINYQSLAGNYINKESIKPLLKDALYLMSMFLNTGNYFMHRQSYLETAIPLQDIPKFEYGDIVVNREWLKNNYMFVVEGMRYVHRRRKDSVWREHAKEMQPRINQMLNELK